MKKTELLKQAWSKLLQYDSFVLACHVRPDGDTLGSALGLAHALRKFGKDVLVISPDGVPNNYTFIPESDTIVTHTDRRNFDVGMLVDSEGLKRIGSAAEVIESARVKACVDHHVPNGQFGEIRVVDHTLSSTAELVVELLDANNVEIDTNCATQLLAGLIGDTGAFRFANTTSKTFSIAARLTELGAEPWHIAREIYDSRPLRSVKLLGRALSSLETSPNCKVIWATIKRSDLDDLNCTDADTESIVNQVAGVKGPKVAILFRETQPGVIRVSLRSRDGVDVDKIAREFGGGGHLAAAGCTVSAPLDEAKRRVIEEVLKWTES